MWFGVGVGFFLSIVIEFKFFMFKIFYMLIDEVLFLVIQLLLLIVDVYIVIVGIVVEICDILLFGCILLQFLELLFDVQKVSDDLVEFGQLVIILDVNIIKLLNIFVLVLQLKVVIKELQDQGYLLLDYLEILVDDQQCDYKVCYDKVKGSVVNLVLCEGNFDCCVLLLVKNYVCKYLYCMGVWLVDLKLYVVYMVVGDFYGSEKLVIVVNVGLLKIIFYGKDGSVVVLKEKIVVKVGEIVDVVVMSCKVLVVFIGEQIVDVKVQGVLFLLYLKVIMMKVFDLIMFGVVVNEFYKDVLVKYVEVFKQVGFDVNNGIGDLVVCLLLLLEVICVVIEVDLVVEYVQCLGVVMVNLDKGIINLYVLSDVIVDVLMLVMICDFGKMWNVEGKLQDIKVVILDCCYVGVYQVVIDDCKVYGVFDLVIMGLVFNVGLMVQKVEEYGLYDKIFQIVVDGVVKVIDDVGIVVFEYVVEVGDIWCMCQIKDVLIQDWVKFVVECVCLSSILVVFWLDVVCVYDVQVIVKVEQYLKDYDIIGLDICILLLVEVIVFLLDCICKGEDIILVIGNVLCDYLIDLFLIMELGISVKMLLIVLLMVGGGLFEIGVGGLVLKYVQQFVEEDYLCWDLLGEFLVLVVLLEYLGNCYDNVVVCVLVKVLDEVNGQFLDNDKLLLCKLGGIDNRGSYFYIVLYWVQVLVVQDEDVVLKVCFVLLVKVLIDNEQKIVDELIVVQGKVVDIGGYYCLDVVKVSKVMCLSVIFNVVLEQLCG